MKLFNKTIDRQLFKQYALGSDLSKQEVVAKIFNPYGAGLWFILNSDPQDPDYLWAIVDLGYGAEVGSVSRTDLETYRGRFGLGFERDLSFDPVNALELYNGLSGGKYYADGGKVSKKETEVWGYVKSNGELYYFSSHSRGLDDLMMYEKIDVIQLNDYDGGKDFFLGYGSKSRVNGITEKKSDGRLFFGKWNKGFVDNENYPKGNMLGRHKIKYADGGNIADFSDNQRMIMNQNVEVEHHHEELEDILEDKVPVPAWVVAKMETATQNLSDITHYLDGQKEIMEDQLEEDDDDDDDDKMELDEIENKEVVEPINVSAGTKAELTKKFTDDAWGNLRGFLKGMEGIDLRDDYTFDYRDEQFEVEPIINSDENGVSNAVFTIFDGDGEEQGEVAYSRDGGKQKFTANSDYFEWNNAKFEDGGYFDGAIPKTSSYMSNYADGGEILLRKDLIQEFYEINGLDSYDASYMKNHSIVDGHEVVTESQAYADLGYWKALYPNLKDYVLRKSEKYSKGGEVAKGEILGLKKNILGTTDVEMKITGMRKPQRFSVYPIGKDDLDKIITIQSETRIGKIDLSSGRGLMSQSHSNGAYFVHFQMDRLTPFTLNESNLEELKMHIFRTAGDKVGSRGIFSDNSGASGVYAEGGEVYSHKHSKGWGEDITIELLEPTAKGWKVKQTTKKGRKTSSKTAFFSKQEISELFEKQYGNGGGVKDKNGFNLYNKLDDKKNKDFWVWEYKKPSDVIEDKTDAKMFEDYTEKQIVDYLISRKASGYNYAFYIQGKKDVDFIFVSQTWEDTWDKYDNNNYAKGGGVYDYVSMKRLLSEFKNEKEIFDGQIVNRGTNDFKIENNNFYIKRPNENWKIFRKIKYADGGVTTLSGYPKEVIEEKFRSKANITWKHRKPDNWKTYYDIWDELTSVGKLSFLNWISDDLQKKGIYIDKEEADKISKIDYRNVNVASLSKPQVIVWITFMNYAYSKSDIKKWNSKKLEDGGFMNDVYADGGGIGFIPMDLEETLSILAKWGGTNIKGVIGILNAMIDSGVTNEDLIPKPTKYTSFQIEKATEKKIQEIWDKIKPNYKGNFEGNMYYSTLKEMISRNWIYKDVLEKFKPYRKYQKDSFADGGFMNDVYADGGELSNYTVTIVYPRLPLKGERSNWAYNENIDLDVLAKNETQAKKKALIKFSEMFPNEKPSITSVNSNRYKFLDKAGLQDGGFMNDVYAKGGNLKNYILKADIKTVTVKRNGKEVTYKGADVLNGAHVLAKGGDITSKANYVSKRDVVEVELKDGSKIKPANGYWIKKGAEPVNGQTTPTSSTSSQPKIGVTDIRKDMRGNWRAETTIDNFNGYDWRLSTIKTYSGNLVSSAQGGKTEATGSKGIKMFIYAMYQDPNYTLEVSKPKRITDKVVTEQHDKALAKFKKFMETGMFKGGGKISNFDKLSAKVAKQYEGKPVKSQYQEEYGKYYSKEEAKEVGDKVAGKVKAMQSDEKAFGGFFGGGLKSSAKKYPNLDDTIVTTKNGKAVFVISQTSDILLVIDANKIGTGVAPQKINISEIDPTSFKSGGKIEGKRENSGTEMLKKANDLAKKIRKDGESWLDAKKRAFAQLKN